MKLKGSITEQSVRYGGDRFVATILVITDENDVGETVWTQGFDWYSTAEEAMETEIQAIREKLKPPVVVFEKEWDL